MGHFINVFKYFINISFYFIDCNKSIFNFYVTVQTYKREVCVCLCMCVLKWVRIKELVIVKRTLNGY